MWISGSSAQLWHCIMYTEAYTVVRTDAGLVKLLK